MKILVTNDDGINAPGIYELAKWAKQYGDVTIVAPKVENSGKSHSIDIHNNFEIKQVKDYPLDGVKAYSVDSTPADCVRYAFVGLDTHFDLVLSGINRGFNVGEDIVYSATCGAVFEAGYYKGTKAIAFSTSRTGLDQAKNYLDIAYKIIIDNNMFDYSDIYNVNIPENPKSIEITRQGGAYYKDKFINVEGDLYFQDGYSVHDGSSDLSIDTDATLNGHLSITPLTVERTNINAYNKIKDIKINNCK